MSWHDPRMNPKQTIRPFVSSLISVRLFLLLLGFLGFAPLPAAELPPTNPSFVRVNVVRTNTIYGKRWFVWAVHPVGEVWTLTASTEVGNPDAWFNLTNYSDEGGVVSSVVPDTGRTMIFRARRRR